MQQHLRILFKWVLVLASFSAMADPLTGEMAKIVTAPAPQDECLAAVIINKIDGVKRTMPARGFLIEPGIHSINGLALLDATRCSPLDDNQQMTSATDLEVNFEAGYSYFIAYDRSHQSADEWKLIVWKVEQPQPDLPEAVVQ